MHDTRMMQRELQHSWMLLQARSVLLCTTPTTPLCPPIQNSDWIMCVILDKKCVICWLCINTTYLLFLSNLLKRKDGVKDNIGDLRGKKTSQLQYFRGQVRTKDWKKKTQFD